MNAHTSSMPGHPGVCTSSSGPLGSPTKYPFAGEGRSPISHFSTFAAYPEAGHLSTVSSPLAQFTMNSWLADPPIGPDSASTAEKSSPQRVKMFVYARYMASYVSFSPPGPSTVRWNEYASFIRNSRHRSSPARGRASSRNFVWIW